MDLLILNYIVSEARPLHTVEEVSFVEMVHGLNPNAVVMGVQKLRRLINEARSEFQDHVICQLKPIKFVCLTADMWSTLHRSFFGVTAHWIDPCSKERRSIALSCQRVIGDYI